MNKSQLLQKLNEVEWEDFECKSARNALPKSIWETVSAFSNTLGGWIVLGIQQKGKQFNPVGVSDPEKIEQDFLNTLNNHKFNIRIHPKSRVYNIDSKIILAFFIPPSSKKPVYYHSPANTFIRTGSSNRKASNEEIDAMFRDQSFGLKGEEFIQGTSIEDLSFLSVDQYMGYMKKQNPALEYNRLSASDFLQKTKVIISDKITYSGLLFFGKRDSIDRYFSDFRIDLFEIPGTSYKNASPRYTYRLPEQENIWEYYFLLFQRITHSIEQPFRMNEKGFGTGLYPQIEALREALVNMLMHADYFSTIKSRIRLFSDRIEFSNPGCFPKSIEELKKSDISILRNPIIAKLFRIVKLAENAGFGFDKMIKGWESYCGMEPIFQNEIDTAIVTFPLPSANYTTQETEKDSLRNKGKLSKKQKNTTQETEKDSLRNKGKLSKKQKNTTQEKILFYLESDPSLTMKNLAEKIGITEYGVKYHLRILKQNKRIQRTGSTKKGKWIVLH